MNLSWLANHRPTGALSLCIALTLGACGDDSPSTGGDQEADAKVASDAGTRSDASSGDAGKPDSGSKPASDAGAPSDDGGGASSATLDALAGRYLMRWDVLGTASSNFLGGEMKVRSRLSTLVVAELSVEGGKLMSKERVCTQVAEQKCESICDTASTVVDPRTIKDFLLKKYQAREFTLSSDGTLTAERAVAQLGYDDTDLDTAAPTSSDDKRVWDVISGSPREGFLTKVSISSLGLTVACNVYGTQKFVTTFSGKLGGTDDAPELPATMTLDLLDSDAQRLGADMDTCANQEADSPVDSQNARMVRYDADPSDAFWDCPADSVFDSMMAPTPLYPAP